MTVIDRQSVWGLTPPEVHDRFWAARGVQVVRRGEPSNIVIGADIFLLTDSRSLTIFDLAPLLDTLCWTKPELLYVRIRDDREHGYREFAITDECKRFLSFERSYGGCDSRLARVCLTTRADLAQAWQSALDASAGWTALRRAVSRPLRWTQTVSGTVYDRSSDEHILEFGRSIVRNWKRPDATIGRAQHWGDGAWTDPSARVSNSAKFIGPVWVGAGRLVEDGVVVGPSILWDDPEEKPAAEALQWDDIEPTHDQSGRYDLGEGLVPRLESSRLRGFRRFLDLTLATLGILITLPLYPFIMLAIWLEDGTPFFFGHRRETIGGRTFTCIKFRSMHKDAEKMKAALQTRNEADGPQFFIGDDPRLTRVGTFLRKYNLDELPQFFNVVLGHMSVVGPRPSPHGENQYCPAWREARLSVRPGITGLWQVQRTRRPGADFQEWIKYDLEYVGRRSLSLDLWIVWKTFLLMVSKGTGS